MQARRWVVPGAAVLILAVLAAVWVWRGRQSTLEPGAVDLIELFPESEKRTTMGSLEDGFAIQTVTIDGQRQRSLFAHPFSRIIWTIDVPEGAVLRASAALRPDSWPLEGDGAVFRVGVSEGDTYTEYFRRVVAPQVEPGDRHWLPVEIDLSAHAGQRVKVIFNTEPGPSGNAVSDACVWGSPRIVPGATSQ